jgi:hypothetical protein
LGGTLWWSLLGVSLLKWLHGARLDGYTAMFVRAEQEARPENKAIIERYRQALQPGLAQIAKLLATAG